MTSRTKPKNVVTAPKNGRMFTVNVARMDRYLNDTRGQFIERLKTSKRSEDEVGGVLAGPLRSSRSR